MICDTEMFAPELPTICVGLRGIVYGELHVQGAEADLHSGVYGGAAPNPHPGDRGDPLRAEGSRRAHPDPRLLRSRRSRRAQTEMEAWERLPFDPEHFRAEEMKAPAHDRRAGDQRSRAHVGAADAGGARHSRRIHRRRREDRDSRPRRGEDQHAAGAGSAAGGGLAATWGSDCGSLPEGRDRGVEADPRRRRRP